MGAWVVRLDPSKKSLKVSGWSSVEQPLTAILPGDNVGLSSGALSPCGMPGHALGVVDDDSRIAHDALDAALPYTPFADGRLSSPHGHRGYLFSIESIPPEFRADPAGNDAAAAAFRRYGHTGAKWLQWKQGKQTKLELRGEGQQSAFPPSMHHSGERREWVEGKPGQPTVIDFMALVLKLDAVAQSFGWSLTKDAQKKLDAWKAKRPTDAPPTDAPATDAPPTDAPPTDAPPVAVAPDLPQREGASAWVCDPDQDRASRAYRATLEKVVRDGDAPRNGHGGDPATFRLLAYGLSRFGRTPEGVVEDFCAVMNAHLRDVPDLSDPTKRVDDAWTLDAIRRKVESVYRRGPSAEYGNGWKPADDAPRAATDPKRLAGEYLAACNADGRPFVVVKDQVYRFDAGAYAPEYDGSFTDAVRQFVERAAVAQFRDDQHTHDAATGKLAAAKEQAEAEAAASDDKGKKRKADAAAKAMDKHAAAKPKAVHPVTIRDVMEVAAAARSMRRQRDDLTPGEWLDGRRERRLAVANGLLDVRTGTLHAHDPAFFTLAKLPAAFDPDATAQQWSECVDVWMQGDAERVAVLQELAGACLDTSLTVPIIGALPGNGANGKSVFLGVTRAVLGPANVAAVALDQLSGNRFAAYGLLGKLANLVADQGFFKSSDEGPLKQLSSGVDTFSFEAKGKQPLYAVNSAKIIFACNTLPLFADPTEAIWRRLVVVPFRHAIPEKDRRPELLDPEHWRPALSGILNWMLAGLKRLHMTGGGTKSVVCERAKERHRDDSDITALFVRDTFVKDADGFVSNHAIALLHASWAFGNGMHNRDKISPVTIGRAIGRAFPDAETKLRKDATTKAPVRGWAGIAMRSEQPAPTRETVTDGTDGNRCRAASVTAASA